MSLNVQRITLPIFILLFFTACNNQKHPEKIVADDDKPANPKTELEFEKISSKITSTGYSLSYFIPSKDSSKRFPVMIFLDPHGKGDYPVTKYIQLAEQFGFILIGSNDSKNGMEFSESQTIVASLLNEAINIFPSIKNSIALAGFSGGAKAALVTGNSLSDIAAIVYCGAALPPSGIQLSKPVFAFAGKKDMNLTEVKMFDASLNQNEISHAYFEWTGKHEWPDSISFTHAFYWSIFTSMKNHSIENIPALLNSFQKFIAQSVAKEKNPLHKSELYHEAIAMLSGITSVQSYQSNMKELERSHEFILAMNARQRILAAEDEKKKELLNAFNSENLSWWKKEIVSLSSNKNNESNVRLLGYISLASWSYSTKAIAANDFPRAKDILTIYQLADPENSEQPFLSACLYAKNGIPDSAVVFLRDAVKLGLKDRGKIEMEKDLYPLHGRKDYQEVVSAMH